MMNVNQRYDESLKYDELESKIWRKLLRNMTNKITDDVFL